MQEVETVEIDLTDLLELIYWARRYCDNISTYSSYSFNLVYMNIEKTYSELPSRDQFDHTLYNKGEFWPYAQDRMYNPNTGDFDAIPRKKNNKGKS